jgi:endogenous inhibitor of DNA gyrase (YacG/DUF329 family)
MPDLPERVQFEDPFLPFCSDRCRLIDLGNWASEKYVIIASRIPRQKKTTIEALARLLGTWFGCGYVPKARHGRVHWALW